MRARISVDWSPEVLPCAPRPINGELLSSWARRLAAANLITLPELCACLEDLTQSQEPAAVFDYGSPKAWRLAIARMTRIREQWVWALDLQQQFPAIDREWFLHDAAWPEKIVSGFCPECFSEQIAAGQTLHLKAEWAVALVTRCFVHQLPLYRYCPWCGKDQPVHFQANAIECLYCEDQLTIRRWTPNPASPEPLIAAFDRTVVETLAGRAPDPMWAGEFTAPSFCRLLRDLLWMLTTPELIDPRYGLSLVDRVVADRFRPKFHYGDNFEAPFHERSWTEREAVVCAIIQILLGSAADRALGVGGYALRKSAEFRPFVEILRSVEREEHRLWTRIGQWPGSLQDRAGNALRFLEAKQAKQRRA